MKQQLRVAIAGGGTGGHLFPALNLGQAMQQRWQAQLLFFGSPRGIENRVLPQKGYALILLPVQGFHRRFTLKNLLFPVNLWRSLRKSKKALQQFAPHLVLGTGGYVMGPVLRAAKKLGVPMVIQEQNSFPGVTTRLLAKEADYVFLAYEEAKQYLPAEAKTVITGNPVLIKAPFSSKKQAKQALGFEQDMPLIAVIGGSQGAQSINRALLELFIKGKQPRNVQWLWQTGAAHFEHCKKEIENLKLNRVHLQPFIEQMAAVYQAADLVVCRAGAMTLSELMAMGSPAVLVPFPYAAANHQFKNAQALEKKGAAVVVKDDEQLAQKLSQILPELLSDSERLQKMAAAMKQLHPKNSIERMLDLMEQLLKERGLFEGERS